MTQANTPHPSSLGGAKLVIVAIALGLAAVVLNYFYVQGVRRAENETSFKAYILTRAMRAGERIKERDVNVVTLPQRFEQSFHNIGAVNESDWLGDVNKQVQRSVSAGSILRREDFQPPTDTRELDIDITPNMRRVSLPVNSRTISGMLRAGMWVDIEAPFQTGGALPTILPVLERIKVIAVGTQVVGADDSAGPSRAPSSYHTITIEVTPQDATNLAMIERLAAGDFEIQIRNPGDTKYVKIPPPSGDSGINPAVMDLLRIKLGEPPAPKR